jgi:hypothetical protein
VTPERHIQESPSRRFLYLLVGQYATVAYIDGPPAHPLRDWGRDSYHPAPSSLPCRRLGGKCLNHGKCIDRPAASRHSGWHAGAPAWVAPGVESGAPMRRHCGGDRPKFGARQPWPRHPEGARELRIMVLVSGLLLVAQMRGVGGCEPQR